MRRNFWLWVTIILKWPQDRRNLIRRNPDLGVFFNCVFFIKTIYLWVLLNGFKKAFTVHSRFLTILPKLLWITNVAKPSTFAKAGNTDLNIECITTLPLKTYPELAWFIRHGKACVNCTLIKRGMTDLKTHHNCQHYKSNQMLCVVLRSSEHNYSRRMEGQGRRIYQLSLTCLTVRT